MFVSPERGFKNVYFKFMSFIQYLKDTRGELRHVAWPTQSQTTIYTALVIAVSIFAALYLGLFDFLFTSGLKNIINVLPVTVDPASQLDVSSEVVFMPADTVIVDGEVLPPANETGGSVTP